MSLKIMVILTVFCVLVTQAWCELTFPPGFRLGAGTSAYQVEGAWNVSDKSESMWDRFFHENTEYGNADVTSDSYHNWQRDVEIAVELGLQFYRFSISWTRLLPSGHPDHISEDGKNYYNNLIDELLKHGIEPLVTIHHFDVPQSIHKQGGWINPQMTDWFADYTRVVFSLFGDRVKTWLTINEPLMVCFLIPYEIYPANLVEPFQCTKNVLLAHAKAWRVYNNEFKSKFHGGVSIANHLIWYEPESETDEDLELAELAMQLCNGLVSHPIYSAEGGWPSSVENAIEEYSRQQGYNESRLPPFTQEEIDLIRGTYDYFALNYYTSRVIRKAEPGEEIGTWPFEGSPELDAVLYVRPDWETTVDDTFTLYPDGVRRLLLWLKEQYGDHKFFITENGYPSNGSSLEDEKRSHSIHDILDKLVLAYEEGVNVQGYTAWSLIDTFEFISGYNLHFGLYEVNFTDPLRTRTPRSSARYYRGLTDAARQADDRSC